MTSVPRLPVSTASDSAPLRRDVIFRDVDYTEMVVPDDGQIGAKAFMKQLHRMRKGFGCEPNEDGTWTFYIAEWNEPSRWEIA